MVNIFFTSDTHLGHANIIKYCNRPFNSLEEMNNTIIRNWNNIVKPEDTVFFLGDFCFKNTTGGKEGEGINVTSDSWRKQLNGDIIFIKGNHDKNNTNNTKLTSATLKMGGYDMFLVHNPEDYNHKFKINLVGHVHEKWKYKIINKNLLINVGVDIWDFKPVSFEKLYKFIKSLDF